jgi:hypothetical protein
MIDDVRRLLLRELAALGREIELFPDDEAVWRTAPGVTNSAGTLALHVCGNLKHYVGAVLGATGYERDREAEFRTRDLSRDEIAREIRWTSDVVASVLPGVSEERLAAAYPERVGGVELPCRLFLLHLCIHLSLHLGQAGYLRRIVTGSTASSGPVSLKALAEG